MQQKIKLTPGYDPDKYRDELCEIFNLEQGTMPLRDYLILINEKVRMLYPHKVFISVGTELKSHEK